MSTETVIVRKRYFPFRAESKKFVEESLAFNTAKVSWPLDGNEEVVYSLP